MARVRFEVSGARVRLDAAATIAAMREEKREADEQAAAKEMAKRVATAGTIAGGVRRGR